MSQTNNALRMEILTKNVHRWGRIHQRPPRVAIVLGSGLGELVGRVSCLEQVSFADMPGLEQPSVPGHQGKLILGTWAGQTVLIFSGRLHFYEGHSWEKVVQPVRIARELGAEVLLLTNAAGGIREDLVPGSLLAVNAHLDWTVPAPAGQSVRFSIAVAAAGVGSCTRHDLAERPICPGHRPML